jgi:hypothetical protein
MKPGEENKLTPIQQPPGQPATAGNRGSLRNGKSSRSQLIAFTTPSAVVRQDELVEERIMYQKAMRRVEEWQEKARAIRAAIEAGATVEPGIYRAEVVDENCETPLGFTFPIRRLVVS